jgi:hypothetical protein
MEEMPLRFPAEDGIRQAGQTEETAIVREDRGGLDVSRAVGRGPSSSRRPRAGLLTLRKPAAEAVQVTAVEDKLVEVPETPVEERVSEDAPTPQAPEPVIEETPESKEPSPVVEAPSDGEPSPGVETPEVEQPVAPESAPSLPAGEPDGKKPVDQSSPESARRQLDGPISQVRIKSCRWQTAERTLAKLPLNSAHQLSRNTSALFIDPLAQPWSSNRHSRYSCGIWHRPLYFEQALKERCGVGAGCLTTAASATAFVGQALILPYQVLVLGPCTPVAPLGDCETGSCFEFGVTIPRPFATEADDLLAECQ